jgi:N,N'-diacetylchitobiose transport system permease protein
MSAVQSERRQPPASLGERPAPTRKRRGISLGNRLFPYILILPCLAVLIGVLLYPLVRVVQLSLQDVNNFLLFKYVKLDQYIGFKGFSNVLTSGEFWQVVERSLLFTIEVVVLSLAIGLGVALLLNRVSNWAKIFVVTVLMFVWAIPAIVTGIVFKWIFSDTSGVVDYILYELGGKGMRGYNWVANSTQGLYIVVAGMVVWGALPFLVLGLNAAITQVPKELVEAAKVDGASPWENFRHVVLPIIRPFLLMCFSLSFIWDFQVFSQIWVWTDAVPADGYQTIGVYIYEKSFTADKYSLGAVVSIIMIVMMISVMAVYVRQILRIGTESK